MCRKVIGDAACDYEAEFAKTGDRETALCSSETWRNARCRKGGLCGCPAGFCANEGGVCVPEAEDGALTARSEHDNVCLNADGMVEPFVLTVDGSRGGPYHRCVALRSRTLG